MHDRELRKIALREARELCQFDGTPGAKPVLEAAEAIYQWLRHGPAEVPAQPDLFAVHDSYKPESGESTWVHKSMGVNVTCVHPEFWEKEQGYDWPVTRETHIEFRATGTGEPTRTVSTANGRYDLFDTDWPNPVVA